MSGAAATMSRAKVLVVGIGNPDRGDDGIGPLVATRLAGRAAAGRRHLLRDVAICSP